MRANDAVGQYGERLAAAHLAAAGWDILDRNWRCSQGEIDIVAKDGHTVVVVEVKTRTGTNFGHPAEAVNAAKLARLRRLTGQWLHEHGGGAPEARIDVIAIIIGRSGGAQIDHLIGVS